MMRAAGKSAFVSALCAAAAAVIFLCGCSGGGGTVSENALSEQAGKQVNIQEAAKEPSPEPERKTTAAETAENLSEQQKQTDTKPSSREKTAEEEPTVNTVADAGCVSAEQQNEAEDNTAEEAENGLFCTLSIRCDTVFENMDKLNPQKAEIIPRDGIILSQRTVAFYEGESVFDVLVRELKKNKIHIDFVNTPAYNTAYIKGIGNLYERDCGDTSGWLYLVNGNVPGYGCSQYILKPGDKIRWVYSCMPGDNF